MRKLISAALLSIFALTMTTAAFGAEKSTASQLIALANSNNPALRDAITATFDAKDLKEGTAWIAQGPEFFFATRGSFATYFAD